MRDIYIKNCPSCGAGENIFHGTGENETPYGVLFAGQQDSEGNVHPVMEKIMVVQPVTCTNCGLVLLFNPRKP